MFLYSILNKNNLMPTTPYSVFIIISSLSKGDNEYLLLLNFSSSISWFKTKTQKRLSVY